MQTVTEVFHLIEVPAVIFCERKLVEVEKKPVDSKQKIVNAENSNNKSVQNQKLKAFKSQKQAYKEDKAFRLRALSSGKSFNFLN